MKKIIFFVSVLIIAPINAMLVDFFPKEMNLEVFSHIFTCLAFEKINTLDHAMRSLACVNKSYNLLINDSAHTLSLIKRLSSKCNVSDMEITMALRTTRARERYAIQVAALAQWNSLQFNSLNLTTLLPNLDLNFTYSTDFLSLPTMLLQTAGSQEWGHSQIAEFLIKNGADINILTQDNRNASMFAFYFFNNELVPLFLDHSDFQVNHHDNQGNTCLHYCFERGISVAGYPDQINIEKCEQMFFVIQALLKKGADRYAVNNRGETPLDRAKKIGYQPFIDILSIG